MANNNLLNELKGYEAQTNLGYIDSAIVTAIELLKNTDVQFQLHDINNKIINHDDLKQFVTDIVNEETIINVNNIDGKQLPEPLVAMLPETLGYLINTLASATVMNNMLNDLYANATHQVLKAQLMSSEASVNTDLSKDNRIKELEAELARVQGELDRYQVKQGKMEKLYMEATHKLSRINSEHVKEVNKLKSQYTGEIERLNIMIDMLGQDKHVQEVKKLRDENLTLRAKLANKEEDCKKCKLKGVEAMANNEVKVIKETELVTNNTFDGSHKRFYNDDVYKAILLKIREYQDLKSIPRTKCVKELLELDIIKEFIDAGYKLNPQTLFNYHDYAIKFVGKELGVTSASALQTPVEYVSERGAKKVKMVLNKDRLKW